eukprot:5437238-Heterocapsa_arctica.AAC.1
MERGGRTRGERAASGCPRPSRGRPPAETPDRPEAGRRLPALLGGWRRPRRGWGGSVPAAAAGS